MRKTVSSRAEKIFMRALMDHYHETGRPFLALFLKKCAPLRNHPQYLQVLSSLELKGLITIRFADDVPWEIQLTEKGLSYYKAHRLESSERRWNRWPVIIGLVLSAVGILISLLTSGVIHL